MHRCHSTIDIKALMLASPAMLACLRESRRRCLQSITERLKYQIQSDPVLLLALLTSHLRHIREKHQGASRDILRSKIQQVLDNKIDLEGWESNLVALCQLTALFHNGKEFVLHVAPKIELPMPEYMEYLVIAMIQRLNTYCETWEREGLEVHFRFDGYCNALFYGHEPLFEDNTAFEEQFLRLSGIGGNRAEALRAFCNIMKTILLGPYMLDKEWDPYLHGLASSGHDGPRRNWTTEEMKEYFPLAMFEAQGERDPISWENDIFHRLECVERYVRRLCGDDIYISAMRRPRSAIEFPAGLHMY